MVAVLNKGKSGGQSPVSGSRFEYPRTMIAEYFIYRRKGDKEPFISLGEMPQYGLRPKQKFTGKKLKIEVIRRLSGVEIEQTATTPQINAYIEANIYDTERWPEYRKLYRQVAGEVETVADIFTLQYILVAELEDQTRTGKDCQPQPTDPKDERLIHLIRCELMGEPLEMYKTMINPIIALKKRFV